MSDHFSMSKATKTDIGNATVAGLVLSRDPNRAMQEMMDIIDNLNGILTEETRALETADRTTFFGLQEKKIRAAQAYHDGARDILERKDEFSGIREQLRKRLDEKQKVFSETSQHNMKRLLSMSRGVQRFSGHLMEGAREQARKTQAVNYSASGIVSQNPNKTVSIGVIESA